MINTRSMRHAFAHHLRQMHVKYERSTPNIEFVWIKPVRAKNTTDLVKVKSLRSLQKPLLVTVYPNDRIVF